MRAVLGLVAAMASGPALADDRAALCASMIAQLSAIAQASTALIARENAYLDVVASMAAENPDLAVSEVVANAKGVDFGRTLRPAIDALAIAQATITGYCGS